MKLIKVSDRVHEEIQKLSEKLKCSMADVVERLLDYYLTGRETDKPVKQKIDIEIVAKYPTKCSRCGKEIAVGSTFRYIRIMYEDNSSDVIKLCEDCMLNASLLAKHYRRLKQLKAIEREYKRQIDELLDKIEELEAKAGVLDVKRQLGDLLRDLYGALLGSDKELAQKLSEIVLRIEQLESKISEIEVGLKHLISAKSVRRITIKQKRD